MANKEYPPHSTDLIKRLDKMYPPVRPDDSISEKELWGKIYQRRLVDSLMCQYNMNPSPIESDE